MKNKFSYQGTFKCCCGKVVPYFKVFKLRGFNVCTDCYMKKTDYNTVFVRS